MIRTESTHLRSGRLVVALCLLEALIAMSTAMAQSDASFVIPREQFLRKLDLARPELAAVKAALDANDVAKAEHEFIRYWRTRPLHSPFLTNWGALARQRDYKDTKADAFLAGHLDDGFSVYDAPPTGIDWHGSPLCLLTYFQLVKQPRLAYHHTRDPKYLRWVMDYILQYMEAYPIVEFAGKSIDSGWVNHQTVCKPWYWNMILGRLQEWPETLALVRSAPEVSDEELLRMLHRLYQETGYMADHVKEYVDIRHNGGAAMITALAMSATVLQDFAQAQRWLDYSAELTAQFIEQSFYPDGMCVELVTSYSMGVSSGMLKMANALKERPAMVALKPRIAAMIICLAGLTDPTGWMPSFGDLYAAQTGGRLNPQAADWVGLAWVRTLLGETKEPVPPFTVWPQPGQEQWCGYYTMRSGWTPQARFMMVDGGPWGTTHQHGDRLSFVVTALGHRFIIDPSSTIYASNKPDSFVSRQAAGFLHNTITVDGVDEFRGCSKVDCGPIPWETKSPLTNRWEHGDRYSLFAGDYSFAPVKPVKWERRVLFADQHYWLLQDVLSGELTGATIEQNFQFDAEIKIEFQDNVTLATAPGGARVALVPLEGGLTPQLSVGDKEPRVSYWPLGKPSEVLFRGYDGREEKHGRGWTGRNTDKLIPAPAVTYTGKLDTWPPAQITLLIVPLEPGQSLADVPQVTREGEVWALPITGGSLRFETKARECRVLQ